MTPDQTKCEIGEVSKEQLAEHVRTVQALRKYGAPDTPLQLAAEALLSHISNLTARLEQVERDARRLDWLDAEVRSCGYAVEFARNRVNDANGCRLRTQVGSGPWTREYLARGAARAAIDSAMESSKEGV